MAGTREEPSEPRDYLRQIWRRRWVLLGIVVVIPAIAFVVASLLPKTYEATAILEAPTASDAARDVTLIETTRVADGAARLLGDDPSTGRSLANDVASAPLSSGSEESSTPRLIAVTASADSASRAAEIANAFADSYARVSRRALEENIARTTDDLEAARGDAIDPLVERLQQLREAEAIDPVVEEAAPPADPVAPRPLAITAVALVFSVLAAGGLAIVLSAFDRGLRRPEQLEELLGAPLLATIPERAFEVQAPDATSREPFRTLRANLTYLNLDRSIRSVVVASPEQGAGSTTVAINLAVAFAEADQDVVLLDCDLRTSAVATRLGIAPRYGVEDVLAREVELDDALHDIEVDTEAGRLRVLAAGAPPANPSALLESERMASVLHSLSERVAVAVIDTPPLLAVSDAVPLFQHASGALLVARLDATSRDAVARARDLILGSRGTLLGGVVTGAGSGPFAGAGHPSAGTALGTDEAPTFGGRPLRHAYGRARRRPSPRPGD